KITCVSDEIGHTVSSLLDLPPEKFITIPNGTNTEIFYPLDKNECREILHFPKDTFILGFIGSCYPYHDIDTLISTLPNLTDTIPQIRLAIVGDGFMLETWRQQAKRLSIDSIITFTGYVQFQEANLYINAFDICFASYKQGTSVFPMKILDYLACDKPVITSNIPTIKKYFTEMPFFKLVEPENVKSLQNVIMNLYQIRNQEIKTHRDFVLNNYTWTHTAKKIVCLITER
ncbi:glycosyltransferase, partial [bacterium]|nr:glycosyltransferase [bacterium]